MTFSTDSTLSQKGLLSGDTAHVDTTQWEWWCICDLKSCIACAAASLLKCVLYWHCAVSCATAKIMLCHREPDQTFCMVLVNTWLWAHVQCYLWSMVWSRRRWSLHWGHAVTETLPSYTNPQSEGSLGWVPGLLPLVCCQQGVLKVWRECRGVFQCRLAAVVVVRLQ